MKGFKISKLLLPIFGAVAFFCSGSAEKLVILHTNDTHSSIDTLTDGSSGILQRKAILDSVRNVEKNVITIDAGDAVQGTLYFKYFHGDVEYPLMNMSGYDYRILGNHEFDNGMESLATYFKNVEGVPLSANYDFTGTELEGIFQPFDIKEINGKKIGFFGINVDPFSIISQKNINVNFLDPIQSANKTADHLKNDLGCDVVVAISHIGYKMIPGKSSDVEMAKNSENIDLIIGGHSHTLIDPAHPEDNPSLIPNKKGRNVRIAQAGKQGKFIGKLTIDLDNLDGMEGNKIDYELIPVTNRFSEDQLDAVMVEFIRPYSLAVDSVNNVVIGQSLYELPKDRLGGLSNLTADIGFTIGQEIVKEQRGSGNEIPDIELSIMNVGGIRHHIPQGDITEGQILSTYPFSNKFVVVGIKGRDIIEAMRISAFKGGEAISANMRVVTDSLNNLKRVTIDNHEMDPEKEYIVSTIDYVAEGNDDLVTLANHRKIYESDEEVAVPILRWIKNQTALGLPVAPDCTPRFMQDINER